MITVGDRVKFTTKTSEGTMQTFGRVLRIHARAGKKKLGSYDIKPETFLPVTGVKKVNRKFRHVALA